MFGDDDYTSKKWRNRVNNKILSLQSKFLFISFSEKKIAFVTHAFNNEIYADSTEIRAH